MNGKSAVSPFPYLKEGQLIRIIDGPLKGCEGFLLKKQAERNEVSHLCGPSEEACFYRNES